MNKHTRPFHCTSPGCPQSFARRADRTRHENSVHNQEERSTNQLPSNQNASPQHQANHFCPIPTCERSLNSFTRKDHLTQHSRVHAKRSSEQVEHVEEDSGAAVTHRGELSSSAPPTAPGPELPPRKRQRSARREQDFQESETEVERLKRTIIELTDEKKRLQDQVEKQTDIIYSLTRTPRNN